MASSFTRFANQLAHKLQFSTLAKLCDALIEEKNTFLLNTVRHCFVDALLSLMHEVATLDTDYL